MILKLNYNTRNTAKFRSNLNWCICFSKGTLYTRFVLVIGLNFGQTLKTFSTSFPKRVLLIKLR